MHQAIKKNPRKAIAVLSYKAREKGPQGLAEQPAGKKDTKYLIKSINQSPVRMPRLNGGRGRYMYKSGRLVIGTGRYFPLI